MNLGVEVDFVESFVFLIFSRKEGRTAKGIVERLLKLTKIDVMLD